MTPSSTAVAPQSGAALVLTVRDCSFALLNGALFGLLLSILGHSAKIPLLDTLSTPLMGVIFAILALMGLLGGYLLGSLIARGFFQLAKFCIVGATNTAVDLTVLALLGATTSPLSFAPRKILSFIAANMNSFVWNKFWSFGKKEATPETVSHEAILFFAVSALGLLINATISTIVNNVIGPQGTMSAAQWEQIAAAVGVIATLTWNFLGYKFVVFKK